MTVGQLGKPSSSRDGPKIEDEDENEARTRAPLNERRAPDDEEGEHNEVALRCCHH